MSSLLSGLAQDSIPVGDLGRRAAVHVLNRLAYGPRPGDIDRVLSKGIERYIDEQLEPGPDPDLDRRLALFPYVRWSMAETWSYWQIDDRTRNDPAATRTSYISTLHTQLRAGQLVRSAHSGNQLLERMTWFWFNHFNVNLADDYVQYSAHDYERVLRTHALGKFRDVLAASAHHPAMMSYLDNYLSTISKFDRTGRLTSGLNENYGRELLELHTVGVDAGYSQEAVYNAAVVLTGWGLNRAQGRFQFTAGNHDPRETEVFGYAVRSGLMQESGEGLLEFLSRHEKTAAFIAAKLVRHFVGDDPPPSLVRKIAETYLSTDGDIAEMLRAIFHSAEFWNQAFGVGKYKTPFEYVVSTLRALDADVVEPRTTNTVLANMGQPQYGCIPPTGWSDKGREWANPSSHLHRVNFALDLVSLTTSGSSTQPLAGIFVDVPRLLRGSGVDPSKAADVAAFFNREVFGNRLSARTLDAASRLAGSGAVPVANRVAGLLVASPEGQGR